MLLKITFLGILDDSEPFDFFTYGLEKFQRLCKFYVFQKINLSP